MCKRGCWGSCCGESNGIIKIGEKRVQGMPPFLLDYRCTAETVLSMMHAAGIDCAVVTREYLEVYQNEYVCLIAEKYPDRFQNTNNSI